MEDEAGGVVDEVVGREAAVPAFVAENLVVLVVYDVSDDGYWLKPTQMPVICCPWTYP